MTEPAANYSFLSVRTVTMSYSYDAASNRVSLTDPESGILNYSYDQLNRLTGLTDFAGGAFTFSYDALGRRTNLARPNRVNTNYTYDALSRLLAIVHGSGAFTSGTSYSYDAVGNRTGRTDSSQPTGGSLTQAVTNYNYDAIYELTQAVLNGTTTETYTYDAVGNRLSSLGIPSYVYNSSNELTSIGKATFTYDANGNTLSKSTPSGTTSYSWDFENRLTSVTLPNGSVLHFKYDPFGRRIFSDATGRIFVYDGDNIVEDLDLTGKSVARYTQGLGIDEPLEVSQSGIPNYYEADGLGSIVSLSDPSGALANTYTYDSFGNLTGSTGAVSNRFQYTARENVPKAGLYYYRARYYDPVVGRFLNEDPSGFAAGLNFFRYVNNNSPNSTDPFGLFLKQWHYQTTLELARQVFGIGPGCHEKAETVAAADRDQDELVGWYPLYQFLTKQGPAWERPGPHFPNDAVTRTRLQAAFRGCDLRELGAALHSLQDGIAHSGPYANPTIHFVTGALGDVTAQYNHTLTEAARSSTESILRSFKQVCLKCCQ